MTSIYHYLGLLRSKVMYYGKPFNRRRLKRFYGQFVKKGDLCFDVGAHLGNRSQAWLDLGAKVVAVEPQPACVDYLQKHFGDHPNFNLEIAAAGEEMGQATLHVSRLTPTVSTLATEEWMQAIQDKTPYPVSWDEDVEVPLVTLDNLIAKYGLPSFAKIDVEDLEPDVLRGLTQPLPALSYEYYSPTIDRALTCIDLLENLTEYEYNWSFGESQKLNSDRWMSAHEMRAILGNYQPEDRGGDVYARQKT